jgi:hypothetical protein
MVDDPSTFIDQRFDGGESAAVVPTLGVGTGNEDGEGDGNEKNYSIGGCFGSASESD